MSGSLKKHSILNQLIKLTLKNRKCSSRFQVNVYCTKSISELCISDHFRPFSRALFLYQARNNESTHSLKERKNCVECRHMIVNKTGKNNKGVLNRDKKYANLVPRAYKLHGRLEQADSRYEIEGITYTLLYYSSGSWVCCALLDSPPRTISTSIVQGTKKKQNHLSYNKIKLDSFRENYGSKSNGCSLKFSWKNPLNLLSNRLLLTYLNGLFA